MNAALPNNAKCYMLVKGFNINGGIKMVNNVTVLGSLNVDTILRIARLPKTGETMPMSDKNNAGGGKGANQAIAAARCGASTAFIGKIGDDENGKMMLGLLNESNVSTKYVETSSEGTGQAFILLQDSGENSILIYGGANQTISDEDIENAHEVICSADFLVTQFETPILPAVKAFEMAKESGVVTILNPAPAKQVPQELLQHTDLITPNETEAEILTGVHVDNPASQHEAAVKLQELGAKNVIITLGSKGAFYRVGEKEGFVPAFKVRAIDTTAAGDTFLGALSSQLKKDFSNIEEAIVFASRASSLAVQKLGAIPSIPTKKAVEDALK